MRVKSKTKQDMKRSIITEFNQLQEKFMGMVSLLNYNYLNLCIKAEEASLLSGHEPRVLCLDGQEE